MPRATITASGFQELTAHDTESAWIWFISLGLHFRETVISLPAGTTEVLQSDGVTLEKRLLLCSNNYPTLSKPYPGSGQTLEFTPYAFDFIPPESDTTRTPQAKLTFDNVDRLLVDTLRRAEYPLQLDVGIGPVYYDGQTEVASCAGYELWLRDLELVNVSWDVQAITGTLMKENVLVRAFPSNHPVYDQTNFPGLYGANDVVTITTHT